MATPLIRTGLATDQSQSSSESFRGPQFEQELANSRNLSANFPEQIIQFLAPLLIPQQRATDRARSNLQDTFRTTGGSKSSFAGQRFKEFETDAALNEILGITEGAKAFFQPLANLQNNRLSVAGTPLNRASGSSSGTREAFAGDPGFLQEGRLSAAGDLQTQRLNSDASLQAQRLQSDASLQASRIAAANSIASRVGARSGGSARKPSGGVTPSRTGTRTSSGISNLGQINADIDSLLADNPGGIFGSSGGGSSFFDPGSSGGGNISFNADTGRAVSTSGPNSGFNQFGDNFNLQPDFDQDFFEGF